MGGGVKRTLKSKVWSLEQIFTYLEIPDKIFVSRLILYPVLNKTYCPSDDILL